MTRATLLSIVLTCALGRPGYAFAPVEDGARGIEGERVLTFHPHEQARLAGSAPWRQFLATEGAGWQARFDERMETPHRMWGAPIDLGPTDTADAVEAALRAFVDRHAALLGTDASRLRLRSAHHLADRDTWYVDFDVLVGGMPVEGGGITARIRYGGLVMLGAATYPLAPLEGTRRLSRDVAVERAIGLGPAPRARHTEVKTALVAVPIEREGEVLLRPAWRTTSRTAAPLGDWETYVDADDGKLLGTRNRVRYAAGDILAEHDVRTVNGETTVSPLPFVRITDGTTSGFADSQGAFDLPGETTTSTLESPHFRVFNDAGAEASLAFEGSEGLFDDATSTPAERDAYVFLHQVREWGLRVAPEIMPGRMDAHVNLNETCNAYFDGAVNFFEAGDGCNNTGRIADVVYHEWGHGFHYYSLQSGTFDGSLSEGAADTVAFLQTGDNIIAPYFMTNGQGIRNVAPNLVYPDDYVASEYYVHSNGLIFAGAMWDLWDMLVEEYGDEAGTEQVEQILAGLLKGGPTVAESYDEAVFADDDDGDLGNGTPNLCLLAEAFGQHGLGPLGSGTTFLAHHEPTTDAEPGIPSEVEVDLVPVAEQCFPFDPAGGTVHYRVNAGEWQTAPLDIRADTAEGSIPPRRLGDFVEYYVEVEDADGSSVTAPEGGEINPFTFYVGDVLAVHCDDFEQDDGGYVHETLSGWGDDDWAWGNPRGRGGDPDHAVSGSRVWGNDLGSGDGDGLYQNRKYSRLLAPEVDTAHYEGVFLHYWRWLGVEDGFYDQARILANGEMVWANWVNPESKSDHHQDRQWTPQVVDLQGMADRGRVQLAWEIDADEGLSLAGWNIDDVCLFAPATPDNRLGISDFLAEGDGDSTIDLSWTNPSHSPLEEIVVVRRQRDWPEGPRDGKVVFRDEHPDLGALVTFSDDKVHQRGAYYYAVYASDGGTWLSWTIPGFNASLAAVRGDPEEQIGAGCGCDSLPSGMPPLGAALALLGLVGLRRRRTA